MSRQRIHWDTRDYDQKHREKVLLKAQKIQTLRALLEMHEANADHDHEYVLGLRARLRCAVNQFEAMAP